MGYLVRISFLGYNIKSYPDYQKISYNILSYPIISFHILSYPKISSGANFQMGAFSSRNFSMFLTFLKAYKSLPMLWFSAKAWSMYAAIKLKYSNCIDSMVPSSILYAMFKSMSLLK